jgi:hypothetical protein
MGIDVKGSDAKWDRIGWVGDGIRRWKRVGAVLMRFL